jgi:hypothetical protein
MRNKMLCICVTLISEYNSNNGRMAVEVSWPGMLMLIHTLLHFYE